MSRRRKPISNRRHRQSVGRGLIEWRSHDELRAAVRRDGWIVGGIAAYISLWFVTLIPPTDADTVLGGVMLQAVGIPPLVFSVRRWMRARSSLRFAEDADENDQRDFATRAASVDAAVDRLRELVAELGTRQAKRAGREAVVAAQRAAREQRRLLRRELELTRLGAARGAKATVELGLTEVRSELDAIQTSLDGLVLAVVELVGAADDESIRVAVDHIEAAAEQATALALATREVDQIR